jgi:hypothetical protein
VSVSSDPSETKRWVDGDGDAEMKHISVSAIPFVNYLYSVRERATSRLGILILPHLLEQLA